MGEVFRSHKTKAPNRVALRSSVCVAALLAFGLAATIPVQGAQAKGVRKPGSFKVAKIYFETNATACDMGIQIVFDTEGILTGTFRDPSGRPVHMIKTGSGLKEIGGQTEGFLESVEPVISELVTANPNCVPDPEEPTISLDQLEQYFPAGTYRFEGTAADGTRYRDKAELTYNVPDGPVLLSPNGDVDLDPDNPIEINWEPVTTTIPGLASTGEQVPVDIVGYQVIVYDANAGEAPPEFNVIVPATETALAVPAEFLQPDTEYKIEVLAIEAGANQTISEGTFATGASTLPTTASPTEPAPGPTVTR